jgi:hypothetical protein
MSMGRKGEVHEPSVALDQYLEPFALTQLDRCALKEQRTERT